MLSPFNMAALFAALDSAVPPSLLNLPAARRRQSKHAKPQNPPNRKSRLQRNKRYCLKGVRP